MDLLSPTSKKIYEYIKRTVSEKGYSPSVRDIKNALNIKSTSTVQLHIKRLEDEGYIYKEDGKSRTIRVDVEAGSLKNKIPVLGNVQNGASLDPNENFDGYVDFIPPKGCVKEDLFALKAIKSQEAFGILKGDFIICSKISSADPLGTAVALINGDPSVIYKQDASDADVILGKVIASLRFFN